ncbi:MAG: serine/threonine protein kinase [Myxococcales bacterium]|nr:serine/threonine protein kinase [Myxococcales bacterium]MCB9707499.1 serine/threonine protein kinase [Myxococcales bacterium]
MVDRIGNCRILTEIGSGGMAVVYKAVQEPLGRVVAVKALKPSIAVDSQFAKRFEREAHFMASLQHENILHVYDFIKERGTMYIIMEYVEGIDLYDLLERAPRLPVEVAAIIALQVVRALDYAHFRGIIHRDIKPANVIISHRGEVKLMDFGIARDDTLADLTETGTGLGTPSYMSPEQILGDKLDFRSDIFSLGIVLYQMIIGRKPFVEDDTRTVMQKIRLDRYTSPRKLNTTVPRAMERILARCMEKLPANRYLSTQSLIDDLTEFLANRITTNYNANMVLYLREVGAISEVEAEEILAAGAPRGPRTPRGDRGLLRHMVVVQGILFLAALGSGILVQAANGGFSREAVSSPTPALDGPGGTLKVVVDPWADLYINGKYVATTPLARAIALPAGKYFLQLKNPYYSDGEYETIVRTNQTKTLEVKLKRRETSLSVRDRHGQGSSKPMVAP